MQPQANIRRQIRFTSGFVFHAPASLLAKGIPLSAPKMVGVPGVEPGTLRLSSACSNQLSYTPDSDEEF